MQGAIEGATRTETFIGDVVTIVDHSSDRRSYAGRLFGCTARRRLTSGLAVGGFRLSPADRARGQ